MPDLGKDKIWIAEDFDSPETNAQVAGLFTGAPSALARKTKAPRS